MAELNDYSTYVAADKRRQFQFKMVTIFESTKWKISGIAAFVAMNICALLVTVSLAATLSAIGGRETLATHAHSLTYIQYWVLGIAGIAFIVDAVALVSSMVKNRTFRIIVLAFLSTTIILTVSLAAWGSGGGNARKEYFQTTWNRMDRSTKHLFQSYFSCCGFESITEYQTTILPLDKSCYTDNTVTNGTWPNGCYDRVTKTYLEAITLGGSTFGEDKSNPFYAGFVAVFVILTLMQTTLLVLFVISFYHSPNGIGRDIPEMTIQNNHAMSHERSPGTTPTDDTKTRVDDVPKYAVPGEGTEGENVGNRNCATRATDAVSSAFSNGFYWMGIRVGTHPKMTIALSLVVVVCLTMGIVIRYEPPAGSAGFLDEDNQIVTETGLRRSVFYIVERDQFILIVDESNVISSASFNVAREIDTNVKSATGGSANFSTICLKIGNDCKERSLLELWSFDDTALDALTEADILAKVNENNLVSPVFGDAYEVSQVLGGIVGTSPSISSAKAHLLHYVTRILNQDWENAFIDVGRRQYSGVDVYVLASSSRQQESSGSFTGDLPLFFVGFVFIFIYILLMTGKFSLMEHRVYIALMGVSAAGLSMAAGIGLSSCFGLPWSSLHLIVPFLVIGIGVDDMFVILQSWDTVQNDRDNKDLPLHVKAAKTLETAGVSITVTSLTDLVAFGVGASSDLAAFASFSVFVAVCIILLFFLECTFFLSCVVLDERRKLNRYDACLACCYKHDENYKPSKCGQREILHRLFEDGLGRIVANVPFAIIAICMTLGIAGLMAWGFYKLEVRYDPDWYIPLDSYVAVYGDKYEQYYSFGAEASVYVLNADFYNERQKLDNLFARLQSNADLNPVYGSSWFAAYTAYEFTTNSRNVSLATAYANANEFYAGVQTFLSSTSGRKYIYDVVFRNSVIVGSKFDVRHRSVQEQVDNVEIIDSIRRDCEAAEFSSGTSVFPFGNSYFIYEITRIISQEVYRNIGITMLCVLLMVIPMLASLQMGCWVALCVAITTVDVAGTMYFAGLSIETSTIITLLLSIGLAVDYAAHIGHKFLSIKGSRRMRARVAIGEIGLAVFNGGFSTFLALVMLSLSNTYTYRVFFTVFVCVVGYGLWNGLVFLPCVLALIGPPPHANAVEARLSNKHYERKGKVDSRETSMDNIPSTISKRSV